MGKTEEQKYIFIHLMRIFYWHLFTFWLKRFLGACFLVELKKKKNYFVGFCLFVRFLVLIASNGNYLCKSLKL